MKKDSKRKRGRPKEKPNEKVDLVKVWEYAGLGLIDTEIALLLRISPATLNNYKKDPEFLRVLQSGKLEFDAEAVQSLRKRVTGFTFDETTKELNKKTGQLVVTKIVTKYYPPETMACNSWLNNRRRHQWEWSPKPTSGLQDDQLESLRKLAIEAMGENS